MSVRRSALDIEAKPTETNAVSKSTLAFLLLIAAPIASACSEEPQRQEQSLEYPHPGTGRAVDRGLDPRTHRVIERLRSGEIPADENAPAQPE